MKKKVLTYDYEKMERAGSLLNSLTVTGCNNFRILAELADILDSGTSGELYEKEDGGDKDVMDRETIREDKLAKQTINRNGPRRNKPEQD